MQSCCSSHHKSEAFNSPAPSPDIKQPFNHNKASSRFEDQPSLTQDITNINGEEIASPGLYVLYENEPPLLGVEGKSDTPTPSWQRVQKQNNLSSQDADHHSFSPNPIQRSEGTFPPCKS